jgi:hypothetical protein
MVIKMHPNRKKLNDEIAKCKAQGLEVQFVPDKRTADYIGMNDKVGKKLGFRIKGKTLQVDNNLTLKEKRAVLAHERIERGLMAKGSPYWKAHKEALRRENG